MDITLFNIKSYLEDKGVPYTTKGKNITAGWIEINCLFCHDPSMHLGISPSNLFNCWRCGSKGSIIKLVMSLEKVGYTKAISILSKYYLSDLKELRQDIQKRYNHNILPENASKQFMEVQLEQIEAKGFDTSVIEKYDLYAMGITGPYQYRIICPVIEDSRIVNFTAMGVKGQQPKYKHCSNETAIIPMRECIYNIDQVKDIGVIMEGVTDVWRFGPGGVAVMGIEYTPEQINLLIKQRVKKYVVLFDAEPLAQKQARKLAQQLSPFFDVEVYEIDEGDPGDLDEFTINKIREEVGLEKQA